MPVQDSQNQDNISKQFGSPLNNNLDSELLNRKDKESESDETSRGANFRKDRKNNAGGVLTGGGNIRQGQQASRRGSKVDKLKQELKKKLNPFKQGTAAALRMSWQYVWFFGLTLIYINIHAFLRMILPQVFCRLGEEWTMAKPQTGDKGAESASKALLLLEPLALLLADLALIATILIILYLFELLADIVNNPINYLANLGETYINAIVKGLGMD